MNKLKKQELHILFQNIKQEKANKINELYEKCNRLVYSIAFSILKNKEDSEDIVQIVFMKISQIDKNNLTTNETLNYLRKKKQEIDIDEIYYIAEEDKEINKIIDDDSYNKIIAKLNKQEQEIVSLKILSNLSFREISVILDIPIGTVQWKYYSSLYTLRLLLGNISMAIIGILLYIKGNIKTRTMQETNINNDISLDDDVEAEKTEQQESEITSSVENNLDSLENTDNIQNETIEVNEPQEKNIDFNIGILSFTGIFLFFTVIFTIIFVKHQQKAHKNVSK